MSKLSLKILRYLYKMPPPKVSPEQALLIAEEECQRRGWGFRPPIYLEERLTIFWVWTNSNFKGGNASVSVDVYSGKVVESGLIEM